MLKHERPAEEAQLVFNYQTYEEWQGNKTEIVRVHVDSKKQIDWIT